MTLISTDRFISKDDTALLKGLAILIMVFLHVFGGRAVGLAAYSQMIDIHVFGHQLTFLASHFCSICVHLYIFLSGYGYCIVYQKRGCIGIPKKCFKLCLLIGVAAICLYPFSYFFPELNWDFSFSNCWKYLLGYEGNYEWWFLRPYLLILIFSELILKCVGRCRVGMAVLVSLCYFAIKFLIFKGLATGIPVLVQQVCILLLPFALGIICAQKGILWKAKMCSGKKCYRYGGGILLMLLFVMKALWPQGLFDPFIAVVFSCCILGGFGGSHPKLLLILGNMSATMWLTHTFVSIYYLSDFTYGLRIPILIFSFVVVSSYMIAWMIEKLYKFIVERIDL